MAKGVAAPMIGSDSRSAHGVPARRLGQWAHRRSMRVPDRLRAPKRRLHGRRHVTRQGPDALTDFLRQAGVPIPEIERRWQALARRRVHSIPRIALTPAQLPALGL
jgi:hypothetical protein